MSRIRANKITNQAANGAPIVEHGLVVSGILSATSVAIAGTITYEDVTSIDSVGIITARSTFDAQGDVLISDKIVHKSDTNTAIRFPTNDNITFETGGTERLRIDSSGRVAIGLSAYVNTTPSEYDAAANTLIVGTGSGDEGITILSGQNVCNYGSIFFADGNGATNSKRGQLRYEQNNEVMSFYTAGTEKVRITSGGNFGIGTNDPQTLLHLSSSNPLIRLTDTDNNAYSAIGGEGGNLYLYTNSSSRDFIFRGSAEVARLTGDGLLGIGTNNPTVPIQINHASPKIILEDNDNGADVSIANIGGAAVYSSASDVVFQTADTSEKLRITSSGEVLIGTTTDANIKLEVEGSLRAKAANYVAPASGTGLEIYYANSALNDTPSGYLLCYDRSSSAYKKINYDASEHKFRTSGTERLRINSTGQMGLGVSPSRHLDIKDSTGANRIVNVRGTSTSGAFVAFLDANTTDDSKCRVGSIGGNSIGLRGDAHHFQNGAGTDRMVIDSNGKVSIGDGTIDGLLTIKGNSDQVTTPSIRLLDGSDTREVSISNAAGDFVASVHGTDNAIHGHIKMFESGQIDLNNGGASGANTNRLRITTDGYVSGNINMPCWYGSQDTQHNVPNQSFTKIINLGNDVTNPSMNNGGWDESNGRFTAQTGQAGTYYVFGGGGIDDIQANDYVHLRFFKNGSAIGPYARHTNGGGANQISDVRHMMIVTLAEGDYIELNIYHQEGSTEPTEPNRCFFGGYRLSV